MQALIPTIWWALIVGGATVIAVRRPVVALRVSVGLLTTLVLVWLLLCGAGVAAQIRQGGGMHAVETDTPFHGPHRWLGHGVVILSWVTFWWLVPVAVERAIRSGGIWRLLLHLLLASSTLGLVLLSAFTGYLGRAPVTEGSYLRFRVLHTALVPVLGTLSLLAWRVLAGRYRVSVAKTEAIAAVASGRA
jgi:hypothetical protein